MTVEIFVFGSNEAGVHGAGAAKHAHDRWGAQYGIGNGPSGHAYGIPTKDRQLKTLLPHKIETYIREFILYAKDHPNHNFIVTQIGCGLAGYPPEEIAPMFKEVPDNVFLNGAFVKVLLKNTKDKYYHDSGEGYQGSY